MEPLDSDHNVGPGFLETGSDQNHNNGGGVRGEVDTSAPFESVKEAVNRFGGVGFWKPHRKNDTDEEFDAAKAEEKALQLANDLMVKERETLEVLKELEATKTVVEELRVKLQKEAAAVNNQLKESRDGNDETAIDTRSAGGSLMCSSSAPGLILMELKQAKLNLTRTTNDLADIRATVERYNRMIEKERFELEETRRRLSSNCSKISTLKEVDFQRELHRLTSETEEFKKVGEVAKSEVLRSMNQIKQTKRRLKTAEIRLIAARKLKEAARASEALARFEMKSISESQTVPEGEGVTLSFDEYACLKSKAQEVDEGLTREVNASVVKDNESELYKSEILNKVEEATKEVKHSKRVLEEALSKAEAANIDKLKAEEALRKWRSNHGHRRKSTVQNSTKFKNSPCRSNTRLLDGNRHHFGRTVAGPILAPTMSIGQILNRKLLLTEEYYGKGDMKRKVSLAQMLSKPTNGSGSRGVASGNGGVDGGVDGCRGGNSLSGKRKKFGFGRIAFLVAKPSKKKKKHTVSSGLSSTTD